MSEHRLVPGSRYRITSVASRDQTVTTEGTFRGMTSLGSVDALVMEVEEDDDTVTRLVPSHVVVMLDVLEAAGEEESEDADAHIHYG